MKNLVLGLAAIMLVGTNFADAGPLAPKPRVVFTYERSVIEQTGSQTLQELLNTGIYRYFLSGGQSLFVLVNGRPYKTTSHNLESLPVSAIERLEVLDSDGLAAYSGSALGVQGTRGAINVVLRSDLDGFESRAIARAPTSDGGDGWQGSVMWGGEVGDGRMTLGVDILDRAEITAQSREHSQSTWKEGGTFREAKNVSVGGNTIYVVKTDALGKVTVRSAALGDCDTENGYTGPLVNPPGIGNGDKGCGFAYGRIMWNTDSYEQKNAVLNLDQPFGDAADVHVDINVTQSESEFRYAPSVGSFTFTLPDETNDQGENILLKAINDAAGETIADADDAFVVAHRFVSHGNRDWLTKTTQFDIGASVEGPLAEGLHYDARLRIYNFDGSEDGNTFVHEATIAKEIKDGNYNLADPFSTAEAHLEAIKNSSLRLATDIESQYLEARLALEGSGLQIGNRQGSWSVGLEGSKLKEHILKAYHANDGESYDSRQVLGTGGFHYSGERSAGAIFTDFLLPLTEDLDLRMTGRADDLDDVGRTQSWFVGAEYKASDLITLRSSLGIAELAPSFLALNGRLHDNPYVTCDPGRVDPPRKCDRPNPLQVERLTNGSSSLEPSETERIAVGGQIGNDRLFLRAEWYRNSISDAAGANTADWSMQNLPLCVGDDRTNCIERTGNDITIHGSYDNVVDLEVTGINAWVGGAFRPSWGLVALRGSWQHVTDAELRIRDVASNYATPENVISISALANYGSLTAVWRTSYRSGFENSSGTGEYEAWTGHDLTISWSDPVGLEGTRITAGVFNLTDESLSVDTANPAMVDGPTTASWGRTAFLTLNFEF